MGRHASLRTLPLPPPGAPDGPSWTSQGRSFKAPPSGQQARGALLIEVYHARGRYSAPGSVSRQLTSRAALIVEGRIRLTHLLTSFAGDLVDGEFEHGNPAKTTRVGEQALTSRLRVLLQVVDQAPEAVGFGLGILDALNMPPQKTTER